MRMERHFILMHKGVRVSSCLPTLLPLKDQNPDPRAKWLLLTQTQSAWPPLRGMSARQHKIHMLTDKRHHNHWSQPLLDDVKWLHTILRAGNGTVWVSMVVFNSYPNYSVCNKPLPQTGHGQGKNERFQTGLRCIYVFVLPNHGYTRHFTSEPTF